MVECSFAVFYRPVPSLLVFVWSRLLSIRSHFCSRTRIALQRCLARLVGACCGHGPSSFGSSHVLVDSVTFCVLQSMWCLTLRSSVGCLRFRSCVAGPFVVAVSCHVLSCFCGYLQFLNKASDSQVNVFVSLSRQARLHALPRLVTGGGRCRRRRRTATTIARTRPAICR